MTRDELLEKLADPYSMESNYLRDICIAHGLEPGEEAIDRTLEYIEEMNEELSFDDDMDGDHASAFASIGWGTDEDYDPGERI